MHSELALSGYCIGMCHQLFHLFDLQPESDIGKAGTATHTYFLSRLAALLPFVNVESTTAYTEQTPRPAKRRKPNPKSSKEQTPAAIDAAVSKETDTVSGADTGDNN